MAAKRKPARKPGAPTRSPKPSKRRRKRRSFAGQPGGNESWAQFLARHPDIAAQIAARRRVCAEHHDEVRGSVAADAARPKAVAA